MKDLLDHMVKYVARVILTIVLIVVSIVIVTGQDHTSIDKKRHYKSHHRKYSGWYKNSCNLMDRKRAHSSNIRVKNYQPRKDVVLAYSKPVPEITESKREQLRESVTPKIDKVTSEEVDALHKRQDEVLAENDLPVPTSQQQEKVRQRVADKLASKTNVYPLSLDPLYFNFDEDEFSVVDMEPFLVAAEYAIQGRTVLIEGHTDSRGADDYNVKLSIKRVERIRQLMHEIGVPDDRISVVGYGEELKANSNKTEEGRGKNRRVDFTIF